ncbi:MAG: hypothetical protein WC841_03590 [Candidatus Shapirobacteria bacterium]|jgi:hypothetical protein
MSSKDRLLIGQGPGHQDQLISITDRLRASMTNEEVVFSPASQEVINSFAQANQQRFPSILDTCIEAYEASLGSQPPGHEKSHIVENLNLALQIFGQYRTSGNPLTKVEELEVALAIIGHDLGRYAEPSLPKINEKDLEILGPIFLGRKFLRDLNIPDELGNRILYDIASASNPRTEHRTANIVHRCDRIQLGGAVMIPRLVGLGIGELGPEGCDFIVHPPEVAGQFRDNLPHIYKERTLALLTRLEFWMRNVYPPTRPEESVNDDRRKLETAVLLMLGMHGMDDVYKEVFAPELGLVSDPKPFKRPIDPELFKAAREEHTAFISQVNLSSYSDQGSLELATRLMETENVTILPDFADHFRERLEKSSPETNRNRWLVMLYSLETRHQKRLADISRLQHKEQGGALDPLESWIRAELVDREEKYSAIFEPST